MKAAVYTRYGPPDVIQIKELEKPIPKDGEVLVKVYATTVNRTDCGFLRAKPFIVRFFSGLRRPRRTVLGNEFAGRVEAVGKNVTSFALGDDVFGFSEGFGAHAEYLVMAQEDALATMPPNMTHEEVAPSTEGAHYALNDISRAHVQPGQRVLVNGATGAIGSAATQLTKYLGAEVTAVCGTEHVALVKGLGADRVIDYKKDDFTNDGQVYDFVFDAVGKSSFGACKKLLKPGGIYCSTDLGFLAQNPLLALWTAVFGSRKVIFPIPKQSKETVAFLGKLIEEGKFRPVIDRRYPLERIADAYRYVEKGYKTGNVVIVVRQEKTP